MPFGERCINPILILQVDGGILMSRGAAENQLFRVGVNRFLSLLALDIASAAPIRMATETIDTFALT